MCSRDEIFNRTERLLGDEAMERIAQARVILFGVGGVGGWTAEALVRSGIVNLTIVDADNVAVSNINRQIMATTETVGKSKVEVLRQRLLAINPQAEITALHALYTAETAAEFNLDSYHYIIDAIDSLADKASLILEATRTRAKLFSSMGAARKLNPERIHIAEFWKVKGCPLAAALRSKFKKSGVFPSKKFKCVYSDELVENLGTLEDNCGAMTFGKRIINGAVCHITGIFGFTLAALVIEHILKSE